MIPPDRLDQALAKTTLRRNEKLYLERLLRRVHTHFPPGSRVLDAGCGEGQPAEALAALGCQVTAVDIEPHSADWARRGSQGIAFVQAKAEQLPFADSSFDAVWVKDAFHHMENPRQAMAELQRVARPGAPVVVVEANRCNPVFYVHLTLFGNHQHFSRRRFRRFLREADSEYRWYLAESRCLPWDAAWITRLLAWFEEVLEKVKIFNPWLTYHIGVVRGKGQ